MEEEIFDVVNERDEVIGRASRKEVHQRGLLHRATHVLVFNAAGQVFLQKRSLKKDRQAGLWDSSASGHLNVGEDYDSCAIRELREEIGLEMRPPLEKLFKLAASPETDFEHVWIYKCNSDGPLILNTDEIETGGWFTPDQVNRWMSRNPEEFASGLLLIWETLKKKNAQG